MGMFDNYQHIDYIPDNECRFLWKKPKEAIVVGGTCSHVFEVPVRFAEDNPTITIIYNQLDRVTLTKSPSNTDTDKRHLFVHCELNEEETKLFGGTLLDTEVQLKFVYPETGTILYSSKYKLEVISTLKED